MFDTIFVIDDGRANGRDALRLARYLSTEDTGFALGSPRSLADDADVIVVSAGRDARRVLSGAPKPVAIAPLGYSAGPEDRIRVIGVGFDGGTESLAALRAAEQLALEHGATLRVFAVAPRVGGQTSWSGISSTEYTRLMRESLGEQLRDAVASLDPSVRAASAVIPGDPFQELSARSREGLDLLIVGSRGYGPIRRVVFGSVSGELLESVDCPLLVLPRIPTAPDLAPHHLIEQPVR